MDTDIYFLPYVIILNSQPSPINVGHIRFRGKTIRICKVFVALLLRNKQIKAYIFGVV